jgi:hypothetical protein
METSEIKETTLHDKFLESIANIITVPENKESSAEFITICKLYARTGTWFHDTFRGTILRLRKQEPKVDRWQTARSLYVHLKEKGYTARPMSRTEYADTMSRVNCGVVGIDIFQYFYDEFDVYQRLIDITLDALNRHDLKGKWDIAFEEDMTDAILAQHLPRHAGRIWTAGSNPILDQWPECVAHSIWLPVLGFNYLFAEKNEVVAFRRRMATKLTHIMDRVNLCYGISRYLPIIAVESPSDDMEMREVQYDVLREMLPDPRHPFSLSHASYRADVNHFDYTQPRQVLRINALNASNGDEFEGFGPKIQSTDMNGIKAAVNKCLPDAAQRLRFVDDLLPNIAEKINQDLHDCNYHVLKELGRGRDEGVITTAHDEEKFILCASREYTKSYLAIKLDEQVALLHEELDGLEELYFRSIVHQSCTAEKQRLLHHLMQQLADMIETQYNIMSSFLSAIPSGVDVKYEETLEAVRTALEGMENDINTTFECSLDLTGAETYWNTVREKVMPNIMACVQWQLLATTCGNTTLQDILKQQHIFRHATKQHTRFTSSHWGDFLERLHRASRRAATYLGELRQKALTTVYQNLGTTQNRVIGMVQSIRFQYKWHVEMADILIQQFWRGPFIRQIVQARSITEKPMDISFVEARQRNFFLELMETVRRMDLPFELRTGGARSMGKNQSNENIIDDYHIRALARYVYKQEPWFNFIMQHVLPSLSLWLLLFDPKKITPQ